MTIPISEATELIMRYNLRQLILVSLADDQSVCVTTDGCNDAQRHFAAIGGNWVKKALGWPNELCQAESKAVTELKDRITLLEGLLRECKFPPTVNGKRWDEGIEALTKMKRVDEPA